MYVVLNGERPALVLEPLLRVRKPRSNASDVAFHLCGCRGRAIFKRTDLVGNARTLVREANGVAAIKNGDGRLHEVGVDEVLNNLANDREGDRAALLLGKARDLSRNVLKKGPDVRRFYNNHARCGRGIVKDGNAGRVLDHKGLLLVRRLCVAVLNERVERVGHLQTFQHHFIE